MKKAVDLDEVHNVPGLSHQRPGTNPKENAGPKKDDPDKIEKKDVVALQSFWINSDQ